MKITGPNNKITVGALMLSIMMLVSFLVPSLTPEASALSGSPCPAYSIQDVFADPSGNWDGDQVNNSDELYNGLNPCIVDTNEFCVNGGNSLCIYYTYTYIGYPDACQASIDAYPTGDYDHDGIRNAEEVLNGANPCQHPCPNPTNADLALNPNGSWDNDGISNAIEVYRGTNPCSGTTYNPCPYYSLADVSSMPTLDWDQDGATNADEVRAGLNPCQFNSTERLPHVTTQTTVTTVTTQSAATTQSTNRLPHVSTTTTTSYVAATAPTTLCPQGYPYYHLTNGLCYANPIGRWFSF